MHLYSTLWWKDIYTKENICFKSFEKKNIEIVDLQICKEKTNTMPFRVNNRPWCAYICIQLKTNNLGQRFTATFFSNESLPKHTPTRSPWSQYQIRNVPSHNENQISQNLRSPPCLHVVVLIKWLRLFLWTFHTEKIIAGRWKSHKNPQSTQERELSD